eukprot:TRINITY_DN41801_c0_g1_i1.p1 TRINITY_DN41801_c0_g1~~TRINITY_DN41801_c0_g1_i1.p1  ORF type:complete len:315 (+),score=68.42 TRINITY_DN41801_c0_g1_i1:31-975(+)
MAMTHQLQTLARHVPLSLKRCSTSRLNVSKMLRCRKHELQVSRSASSSWQDSEDPGIFRKREGARTREGLTLPEGWIEYKSSARGVYYGHPATGVTQWDIPTGPPTRQQAEASQRERSERYGHRSQDLHPGAEVRLVGLQLPDLEGKTGICQQFDSDGYVRVRLASGELKAVKPKNLMLAAPAASMSPPPDEEPSAGTQERSTGQKRWWFLFPVLLTGGLAAYWLAKYAMLQEADKAAETHRAERAAAKKAAEKAEMAGAGTAQLPPLPPGWCQHRDPASGRFYYWREADPAGSTTWERPSPLKQQSVPDVDRS